MNKQFDLFVKMKCKELSENISRMTYAYIQPDTKQPTVVPAKHYKDILLIRTLFVVKWMKSNQNKCINRNTDLTNYYSNYLLRFL